MNNQPSAATTTYARCDLCRAVVPLRTLRIPVNEFDCPGLDEICEDCREWYDELINVRLRNEREPDPERTPSNNQEPPNPATATARDMVTYLRRSVADELTNLEEILATSEAWLAAHDNEFNRRGLDRKLAEPRAAAAGRRLWLERIDALGSPSEADAAALLAEYALSAVEL